MLVDRIFHYSSMIQSRPVPIEPITKIPLEGDRAKRSEKGFP